MKPHTISLFVLGFVLVLISGCENSFDPRGPYQKRLVVYSILSNSSDSQYVRVFTTYNPSGFDPAEVTADTYVRKATVTLTDDSTTYRLRDTSITRADKSRYTDDIGAYIAYPWHMRLGKSYSLSVASDQGNASATVSVPDAGLLIPNNPFVLKAPDRYNSEDVTVTIKVSPLTRGYVVRLYLDYLVRVGTDWVHKREEVPTSGLSGSGATAQYNYPKLTRRTSDVSQPYITVHFPITVYTGFFTKIVDQYGTDGYKLLTATYILTQVEANLYKYYNLANGFQDEFSVRTDQPDYSNIQGGLGIFGAMTVDSIRVDL
jgi:hypothetical protein